MKRKRFARLIACALLLCLIPGILAFPVSAKYFEDVYPGMLAREFFDAINYVSDNNIMNGTEPTRFSPYENVTRGMFVTILYRYSGSTQRYSSSFSDVPSSQYYYYAVGWANHYGIVNGTTPTTFEPESPLTREQMTVILYRYAKSYEGRTFNASSFASITTHPDYSSVSSYAVESIRWAKTYHLIRLTTDTSYINATSNINRAFVALALANYAKNVTGFPQKDRYSFENKEEDFHSIYVMSSAATNRLESCIDQLYGSDTARAASDKNALRDFIGKEWKGSCLGYVLTTLFDKNGKTDTNKNFGKNSDTMNAVGKPFSNAASIESAINYYQVIQRFAAFRAKIDIYGETNFANGLNALYQNYLSYGPMPFGVVLRDNADHTKTWGHAFLVLKVVKKSNTSYDIYVIDPNNINNYEPICLPLDITSDTQFYDHPLVYLYVFSNSTLNWFDNFDLDGDYNTSHYIPVNYSSPTEASNVEVDITAEEHLENATAATDTSEIATLIVPATEFQLTNASGETLHFDGQTFSGTMEIFSTYYTLNGMSAPCSMILEIPKSDSYEYTGFSEADTSFSIIADGTMGKVSGSGIRTILFDAVKNDLYVDGNEMEFSLCLRTNIPNFEYFYLDGSNSTSFSIGVEGLKVIANGLAGTMEGGYAPETSLIPVTAPLTLTEASAIDFSDAATNGQIRIIADGHTIPNAVLPIASFRSEIIYE